MANSPKTKGKYPHLHFSGLIHLSETLLRQEALFEGSMLRSCWHLDRKFHQFGAGAGQKKPTQFSQDFARASKLGEYFLLEKAPSRFLSTYPKGFFHDLSSRVEGVFGAEFFGLEREQK